MDSGFRRNDRRVATSFRRKPESRNRMNGKLAPCQYVTVIMKLTTKVGSPVWNVGPPWRDSNVIGCLNRNISLTKALELKSSKSGLGQGIMGYGEMVKCLPVRVRTQTGFIVKIHIDKEVQDLYKRELPLKTNIPIFQYSIIPCRWDNLDVTKRLLNSINCRISDSFN